jgi:hypothetical protein
VPPDLEQRFAEVLADAMLSGFDALGRAIMVVAGPEARTLIYAKFEEKLLDATTEEVPT